MTVIAAAAFISDRTIKVFAVRRSDDQFVDDAERVVFLFGDDLDICLFPLDHALDKNDQLIGFGDSLAVNGHINAFASNDLILHKLKNFMKP